MYSQEIIGRRVEIAECEMGWRLEAHSVAEVDDFNARLERKYEAAYSMARSEAQGAQDGANVFQGYLTRALCDPSAPVLSSDEVRFIENERALVACNAGYFLERYYFLKDRQNVIRHFAFQGGQRVLFDAIARIEGMGRAIEIVLPKARQLGCCLDPETKVLTADLRWIRIDDAIPGTRLVACDEMPFAQRRARRLKEAIVEGKRDVYDYAIRLRMEDGRVLIATPDHRFLCKKRGGVDTIWRHAREILVGDDIRTITIPWGDPGYEDGWMGGLLDGEGSLRQKRKAGSEMCVAQVPGDVLERARTYLEYRNYPYREDWDHRKGGESSKLGNKPVAKLVLGRMHDIFRLIGSTKPTRIGAKDWWRLKSLPGKNETAWQKVVSIELLPVQRRMVDLQTSEKTFIAEGFISHNSTFTEGLMLHKAAFTYGAHSVIASADQDKLGLMSQMLFLGYDRLPWWLRPMTSRRVQSARGMIVFGGMESAVSFQHGSQKNPIAMGSTPIAWHLSEVSSFINAYDLIEVGLFKAVHPSNRIFGVAESTAKGDSDWFHDTYFWSKANWESGNARLMALFLPFFVAESMYPNPMEISSHPMPKDWRPEPETRQMMAESELYVASVPVLAGVLGANWKMPREKAHFWEWNFLEARSKGKEKMWFQEMPHTDKACFQGSFDNVFGREVVARAYSDRKTEYAVYGIVGQSIEVRHEPDMEDVDYSLPRVPVKYSNFRGETYRWEFVPLEWTEDWESLEELRDYDAHMNKLFVWHPPERGYDYSIGIDTSNGISEDATCIAVCRRGRSPQEQDVQAAEFRSNQVSHVEAFAWAMAIAAYYGKYMDGQSGSIRHREPYVAVEQIMAVGDTVQLQMANMGYGRFHKMTRYDSDPKHMRKADSRKRGWFTTSWSRPMLTDGFVTYVLNGWYVVHSPWTQYEMDHWEVHLTASGKEKKEHSSDSTDDGIFANAMAAFCPNDRKTQADRSQRQWRADDGRQLIDTNGGHGVYFQV